MKRLAAAVALLLAAGGPSWAASTSEALARAKTLTFDRDYAAARDAWQAVYDGGGGEAALYWIARCSESLGESKRALAEYGRYLAAKPADATLAEESQTSRVSLAVRLYRSGQKETLPIAVEALKSSSRTVRYFAALQVSSLGEMAGRPAIPVLQKIIADERDADLVERATLALLRLDARALPREAPPTRKAPAGRLWIKVRIQEAGEKTPGVSLDLPLALAELVFKSLPDAAQVELRGKGFDAPRFLEQLKDLGPEGIVDIKGQDGARVRVWIE